MKPQDYVALILAAMVFFTVVIKTLLNHFVPMELSGNAHYTEITALWLDFMQVIIGGLIGYMAGSNRP